MTYVLTLKGTTTPILQNGCEIHSTKLSEAREIASIIGADVCQYVKIRRPYYRPEEPVSEDE